MNRDAAAARGGERNPQGQPSPRVMPAVSQPPITHAATTRPLAKRSGFPIASMVARAPEYAAPISPGPCMLMSCGSEADSTGDNPTRMSGDAGENGADSHLPTGAEGVCQAGHVAALGRPPLDR